VAVIAGVVTMVMLLCRGTAPVAPTVTPAAPQEIPPTQDQRNPLGNRQPVTQFSRRDVNNRITPQVDPTQVLIDIPPLQPNVQFSTRQPKGELHTIRYKMN